MLDATTMWATTLKESPLNYAETIKGQLQALIKSARTEAFNRGKVSSKLAVFRIATTTWDAYLNRLATSDIKSTLTYDSFYETMSLLEAELYTLCVDNRIFIGHKPSPLQARILESARKSLAQDPQIRLAKTIHEGLKSPPGKKR